MKAPAIETRFAFEGAAGDVLRDCFERDREGATLSTKFRLYYKLRPFIPIGLRHRLQRFRNQSFQAPKDWFIPTHFLTDFRAAVEKNPDQQVIHPWPDGFKIATSLTHDVETQYGFGMIDQLAKLGEKYGFRSAWNVVPYKYKVDYGLLRDLQDRGHEISVHGYNHDGRLFESRKTFDKRVGPINQAIKKFGATGFRSPMVHRDLDWLQALEVDYDSSCFDVDPFQAMPGGVGGVWPFMAGKLVELPYTLPQDHLLLISLGEVTPAIWIRKFEFLRSLAGLAMPVTHPDYLDTKNRLGVYERFLDFIAEQDGCWNALPNEIATWWRSRDAMSIEQRGGASVIVGPQAERARVLQLSTLT